jgi:GNAT superfamily N-acetyltransferase
MAPPPATLMRFADPAAYLERVAPFLLDHEAEHNLLLGIAGQLAARPDAWGAVPPYQVVVEDGAGGVVAVAQRTAPHNLVVSRIEPAWRDVALDAVMRAAIEDDPATPGVLGPLEESRGIADRWVGARGGRWLETRAERIYQLDTVTMPELPPGAMRRATPDDREQLARWLVAFSVEAMGEVDASYDEAFEAVDRWFETGHRTAYLWEDAGARVCMVGTTGPTPNGIRVGPVYTPPEHRRKGYGSALTAAVSQVELDAGRRFCFLYTDLANPTSNHIYMMIGYRPVADVTEIRFEAGGSRPG